MARLLSAAGDREPPPGAEEAVWRALVRGGEPRPSRGPSIRWLWPAIVAPMCAAAVLLLWPAPGPTPLPAPVERPPVLALAAGEVTVTEADRPEQAAAVGETLAPGARVATGAESRAFVRLGDSGALLGEASRARVRAPGVDVSLELGEATLVARAGRQVVAAGPYAVTSEDAVYAVRFLPERIAAVHVYEGSVELRGPSVEVTIPAGKGWATSLAAAAVDQQATRFDPRGPPVARALAAASHADSALRIEGSDHFAVELDGLWLGPPPVRILAGAGKHAVLGLARDAEVRGEATVSPERETLFTLALPEPRAAVEPAPPVAPEPPAAPRRPSSKPSAKLAYRSPSIIEPAPAPVAPQPESKPTPDIPLARPAPVDPIDAVRARLAVTPQGEEQDSLRYQLAALYTRAGRFAEAVQLYDGLARGGGRHAELSLYEVGRLKRRYLADRNGALAAFTEYRRRFPRGALRPEVDLSLIEGYLEAGSLDAALRELDAFLSAHPRSERRGEVLLLRANVRRERGDCAGALGDYRQLLAGAGPVGDDALYFAAWCEQSIGELEAARAHLREYLDRFPAGRHRAAVERAQSREF